jgi:hypothetical protein
VLGAPRSAAAAQARALLTASAHRRALAGAVFAPPRADLAELRRDFSPAAWVDSFLAAAAEMSDPPPFFLHLQPPPFDSRNGEAGRAAAWLIENGLDVGFTSFGIDLTALPQAERAGAAVELLGPALELELCAVARLAFAPGTEAALLELLRELKGLGVLPDLVWLQPGEDRIGLEAIQRLAPLLAPAGVALSDLAGVGEAPGPLSDAGVRAVFGDDRLLRPRGAAQARPEVEEAEAYLDCDETIAALGLTGSVRLLSGSVAGA